jgi:hypothetical protein
LRKTKTTPMTKTNKMQATGAVGVMTWNTIIFRLVSQLHYKTRGRFADLVRRYAHATLMDLSSAVQSLPPIPANGAEREAAVIRVTGTDGQTASKNLVRFLVPQTANSGDFLRQAETESEVSDNALTPSKTPEILRFSDDSSNCRGRTRTDRRNCQTRKRVRENIRSGRRRIERTSGRFRLASRH